MKLLQMLIGYHNFISGVRLLSNNLTTEVQHEGKKGDQNLAELSSNQFKKKIRCYPI